MKKVFLLISSAILGLVANAETNSEWENNYFDFAPNTVFCCNPNSTEGSTYYLINDDESLTVTLIDATTGRMGAKPSIIDMALPVISPDGIPYTITAIGFPNSSPSSFGIPIRNTTITKNVRRINDFAFGSSTSSLKISNDCEFDYIGYHSFSALTYSPSCDTLRLADEGTLYNVNLIVSKCIVLGENPKLCRRSGDTGSYLFCSPYTPLNHVDIISKSAIPPAMQGDDLTIFEYEDHYTSQYSTLYVPEGSIEAYKADPEWSKFSDIRSITDPGNGSSAIEDIEDTMTDATTEWYTLQGQRLTNRPTAPGIYIELRGKNSRKIAIQGMR